MVEASHQNLVEARILMPFGPIIVMIVGMLVMYYFGAFLLMFAFYPGIYIVEFLKERFRWKPTKTSEMIAVYALSYAWVSALIVVIYYTAK